VPLRSLRVALRGGRVANCRTRRLHESRYTETLQHHGIRQRDEQAVWYLAATPAAVSQWLVRLWRTSAAIDLQRKLSKDPVAEGR
jgi:hypothetical protein